MISTRNASHWEWKYIENEFMRLGMKQWHPGSYHWELIHDIENEMCLLRSKSGEIHDIPSQNFNRPARSILGRCLRHMKAKMAWWTSRVDFPMTRNFWWKSNVDKRFYRWVQFYFSLDKHWFEIAFVLIPIRRNDRISHEPENEYMSLRMRDIGNVSMT